MKHAPMTSARFALPDAAMNCAAVGKRAEGMDALLLCSGYLKPHGLCARSKQQAIEWHRISIGQLNAARSAAERRVSSLRRTKILSPSRSTHQTESELSAGGRVASPLRNEKQA